MKVTLTRQQALALLSCLGYVAQTAMLPGGDWDSEPGKCTYRAAQRGAAALRARLAGANSQAHAVPDPTDVPAATRIAELEAQITKARRTAMLAQRRYGLSPLEARAVANAASQMRDAPDYYDGRKAEYHALRRGLAKLENCIAAAPCTLASAQHPECDTGDNSPGQQPA